MKPVLYSVVGMMATSAAIALPGGAALAGGYCPTSIPGLSSGAFVSAGTNGQTIRSSGTATAANPIGGSGSASDFPLAVNVQAAGSAVEANFGTSGDGSGNATATIAFDVAFCAPPGSTLALPFDIYGFGGVSEFTTGEDPPGGTAQAEIQIYREDELPLTFEATENCDLEAIGAACQPNTGGVTAFTLSGPGGAGSGEIQGCSTLCTESQMQHDLTF